MRTLEIVTSQNVAIDYNLANIGERGVAFIMDAIFMTVIIFILSIVQSYIVPDNYIEVVAYSVTFMVFAFYTLLSEVLMNGQSLGKKLTDRKSVV